MNSIIMNFIQYYPICSLMMSCVTSQVISWGIVDASNSTNTISNKNLKCNNPQFDEITPFITTKRFHIIITQQMKSYGSIFINTCSLYRGNCLLHTNLTIKDAVTKQIIINNDNNYFGTFKSDRCHNYESMIDLTHLNIGTYTVEVSKSLSTTHNQNKFTFYNFTIALECNLESIDARVSHKIPQLLNIHNTSHISCDESVYFESNITDPLTSISYYKLTVNNSTQQPIIISTCNHIGITNNNNINEYYQPDTYLYLLYQHQTQNHKIYSVIDHNDNNIECKIGAILHEKYLSYGEYIIAVSEHIPYDYNYYGKINVSVQCGESVSELLFNTTNATYLQNKSKSSSSFTDTPTISFWIILTVTPMILTLIVMIIWIYQTEKFKRNRKKRNGDRSRHKYDELRVSSKTLENYSSIYNKRSRRKSRTVSHGESSHDTSTGSDTPQIEHISIPMHQKYKHINVNNKTEPCELKLARSISKELGNIINIGSPTDFPRRETTKNMMHVIVPNVSEPKSNELLKQHSNTASLNKHMNYKSKIRNITFDIIESCRNENDLDIYQVLAFRKLDKQSHKLKLFKPFITIGIDYELLAIKPYYKAMYVAIITGILQTFGMCVIGYSAIYTYLMTENNKWCHWTLKDWKRPWIYKIFACLWAIFITLRIGYHLKQLTFTGFTQIIEVIDNDYFKFYKIVNQCIIQIGAIINYITLLVAVFGSYLIIYQVEEGFGATDLALNALAFFFMIELDNIVVTKRDYKDIQLALKQFIEQSYKNKKEGLKENEIKSCCLSKTACFTKYFAFFTAVMAVLFGIYAPWIILICTYNVA